MLGGLVRGMIRAAFRRLHRAHWRGEASLGTSFWGIGVGYGAACMLMISGLAFDPATGKYRSDDAMLAGAVIGFSHYIFASVGIWRSAGRAIASAKVTGRRSAPLLPHLARSWVVLGLAVPLSGLLHLE